MTTPLLKDILDLYASILELDKVRPGANLIEEGGDSLKATILANAIEDSFCVRPELALIFNSTAEELARWCAKAMISQVEGSN